MLIALRIMMPYVYVAVLWCTVNMYVVRTTQAAHTKERHPFVSHRKTKNKKNKD